MKQIVIGLLFIATTFGQDRVVGTGYFGIGKLEGASIDPLHQSISTSGLVLVDGTLAAPQTSKIPTFNVSKIGGEVNSTDGDRVFSFYYRHKAGSTQTGTGGNTVFQVECREDVPTSTSCVNSTAIIDAGGLRHSTFAGWFTFQKFTTDADGTGIEVNPNNQTGVDSGSDYGTPVNRSQGIIITGVGNGKHTAGLVFDTQGGLTSSFFTGIDFRPNSVAGASPAIRLPNNARLSAWNNANSATRDMLWLDTGDATVLNGPSGYIYFSLAGTAKGSWTTNGLRIGDTTAAGSPLDVITGVTTNAIRVSSQGYISSIRSTGLSTEQMLWLDSGDATILNNSGFIYFTLAGVGKASLTANGLRIGDATAATKRLDVGGDAIVSGLTTLKANLNNSPAAYVLNANALGEASVWFQNKAGVNVGSVGLNVAERMYIGTLNASDLQFFTGSGMAWIIDGAGLTGDFIPQGSQKLGSITNPVALGYFTQIGAPANQVTNGYFNGLKTFGALNISGTTIWPNLGSGVSTTLSCPSTQAVKSITVSAGGVTAVACGVP